MTEQLEAGALDRMRWAGRSAAVLRVPDLSPLTAASWARGGAEALAALGFARNDPFSLAILANLLHALAVERRPETSTWRVILVPEMDTAPVAVDLGFSRARGDRLEALGQLLGAGSGSRLGIALADVTRNGVDARQCLRFALHEPETGLEARNGELWVTAMVACRRDLGPLGAADIVATTRTPQVDALELILASLHGLVTGGPLGAALERYLGDDR